jgi:SsrA-binding protein
VSTNGGQKLIAENRKARYEYELLERFEAGLVLQGTEVKSLRDGRVSLAQAYADVRDGEIWLLGADIAIYDAGTHANHEPTRPRKLLLHRDEIASLIGKVAQRGLTLVPLRLYFNDRGKAKLKLGIAKGKKLADKRATEAKRDWQRQKARLLRERG